MVFGNVILIMKNLFSFFCPPCLLHFLSFIFQQAAALLKYSFNPWDTQLVTDLDLGFVLCGDVQALMLQCSFLCL